MDVRESWLQMAAYKAPPVPKRTASPTHNELSGGEEYHGMPVQCVSSHSGWDFDVMDSRVGVVPAELMSGYK